MDTSQNWIENLIWDISHRNEDVQWVASRALARIARSSGTPMAALDDKDSVVGLRSRMGTRPDRR